MEDLGVYSILPLWFTCVAEIICLLLFLALSVWFISLSFKNFSNLKITKIIDEFKIELEKQIDLIRRIDNTLVGIDTRLREIQEKKGFSNDK